MERGNKALFFAAKDVVTWSGKKFKANNRKKTFTGYSKLGNSPNTTYFTC